MGNQPTTEYGQIYSKGSQYDNILCEESMKLFIKRIKHSYIDSFTEFFVIQTVQREAYSKVFKFIEGWKSLPNDHPLVALSPFVDQQGVLCVRSRLEFGWRGWQSSPCYYAQKPVRHQSARA